MYRGKPIFKSIKKIDKKTTASTGFTEVNHDLSYSNEEIDIKDLIPLDSQRVTKGSWTEQRLIERGFDWWAFDILGVCRDINDGKLYVWNGCGRLSIAQLYANKIGMSFKVPCRVVEGTKEQAAFYFAYTQDTPGRRTLTKEVLFVNQVASGMFDEATREATVILPYIGLYIKGDSGKSVPENPAKTDYEISYRGFHEALTNEHMAEGDVPLLKLARDMIVTAWGNKVGFTKINQDVFWAVTCFLKIYPEAQKNGINKALQLFLNGLATTVKDPKNLNWKPKGLSGNSGVAPQLAFGLREAFKLADSWNTNCDNNLQKHRLEALIK
jgi:hypothetical protein